MPLTLDPASTALLCMDFQNGIVARVPDPDALVAREAAALAAARTAGLTIAYVRVAFAPGDSLAGQMAKRISPEMLEHFAHDAPGTQIDARLAPADGDIVVRKIRVGAFSTTDLHTQLADRGIQTLIFTGISTSGVVLSSVRDAHDKDYHLIVVADLVADMDDEVHRVLTEKVFANQADVITSAELLEALGAE